MAKGSFCPVASVIGPLVVEPPPVPVSPVPPAVELLVVEALLPPVPPVVELLAPELLAVVLVVEAPLPPIPPVPLLELLAVELLLAPEPPAPGSTHIPLTQIRTPLQSISLLAPTPRPRPSRRPWRPDPSLCHAGTRAPANPTQKPNHEQAVNRRPDAS